MTDPRIIAEARFFLDNLQAQYEALDVERAAGFIVRIYDPEGKHSNYTGTWDDPVEALAYAERISAEVNGGLAPSDEPYQVTVHPLFEKE